MLSSDFACASCACLLTHGHLACTPPCFAMQKSRELGGFNDSSSTSVLLRAYGRDWPVVQDPTSGDHGHIVWDSGLAILRYLEGHPKLLAEMRGKRVLDIGTGTAIVPSVLATVAQARVVASDLPAVTRHAAKTLAVNPAPFVVLSSGGSCSGGSDSSDSFRQYLKPGSVGLFDYACDDDVGPLLAAGASSELEPFDFIITTDTLYCRRLVAKVMRTAALLCWFGAHPEEMLGRGSAAAPPPAVKRKRTRVLVGSEIRCLDTHAAFLTMARTFFSVKHLALIGADGEGAAGEATGKSIEAPGGRRKGGRGERRRGGGSPSRHGDDDDDDEGHGAAVFDGSGDEEEEGATDGGECGVTLWELKLRPGVGRSDIESMRWPQFEDA